MKVQATPPEWGPRPSCGGVNVFAYELGRCGGACGDSPREAGKIVGGEGEGRSALDQFNIQHWYSTGLVIARYPLRFE